MPAVPPTVRVSVIVVELLIATEAEEMSTPEVKVMFGGAEILNSKPAGAFNTRVTLAPELKSNLLPSLMTMGPKAVQAGDVALAALSARMVAPPVAGVTVTAASAQVARRHR